jgi:hypothetical protein
MKIIKHIVQEGEESKFVEPVGWPTWVIEIDGELMQGPDGRIISCPSRKHAEAVRFDLIVYCSSDTFNDKVTTCAGLHISHISGGARFFSDPVNLPLLVLDELLNDKCLRHYLNSKVINEENYHLNEFFKANNLNKFSLDSISIVGYRANKSKYEPGEFSKQQINKLSEKDRIAFNLLYEKVYNDNVASLGLPDLNLLKILSKDSVSIIHRLFWIQEKITEEELFLIEADEEDEIDITELTKFKTYKYYISLLHSKKEYENRLIKSLPKKFHEMPLAARLSMYAGIKAMVADYQPDFSLSINSFSKCLEIILKTQIFDIYRKKRGGHFLETKYILGITSPNSKARKLSDYIERPPHFIELGSMEFIFQLKGGKTEKHEPILQDFFKFIETETSYSAVLSKDFVKMLEKIRKTRNLKTHKEAAENGHEAAEQFLLVQKCLEYILDGN